MNFKDIILTHNKSIVNSREECDTTTKLGNHFFKLPVVASNMKSVITKEVCQIFDNNNIFYVYHRIDGVEDVLNFTKWSNKNLKITSISVGVQQDWVKLIKQLYKSSINIDYFTVDVALSYNDNIIPILQEINIYYPKSFVILGNGSTPEWLEWVSNLALVDAVKFNIGVSKACQTREFTGFSNNTIDTIVQLKKANKLLKNPLVLITDGGLTVNNNNIHIGDIAKALTLGADWVMSGSLYSRCVDAPSMLNGYYGNASSIAKGNNKNIEGTKIEVETNHKTIQEMINLVHESLQSSISYAGGNNIYCLNSDNIKIKLSNYE